jgi:endonuclease-3
MTAPRPSRARPTASEKPPRAPAARAKKSDSAKSPSPARRAAPAQKRAKAKTRNAASVRARAAEVHARLAATLEAPPCELDFTSPWQLLVATILSAQSTDKMINKVTPGLFARWPTPAALASALQEEVEEVVKPTGFFRNKAKAIRGAAAIVAERFGGEVPRTVEELTALPGVARKTANVVLGTAYRIPSGITVDTHAGRVARRLELTEHDDPEKVEADLTALFPREAWIDTGHRLVLHGRYVCLARKPRCAACPLAELCPSREGEVPETSWTDRAAGERVKVLSRGAEDAAP